jgi:hypothetical protein
MNNVSFPLVFLPRLLKPFSVTCWFCADQLKHPSHFLFRAVRKLTSIGFRIHSNATKTNSPPLNSHFAERLAQLSHYYTTNGHTRVPHDWSGYDELGRWVHRIRAEFHAGKLNPQRVKALNDLGFEWIQKDSIAEVLEREVAK